VSAMTTNTLSPETSEANIVRQELLDALQLAWMTFGRLDLYTESTTERQKLERLQSQVSKMMRELKGGKQ